jgi:uncharacterized protein
LSGPRYAYFDTSALVKLAVHEKETTALEQAALGRDALFSSAVSVTELTRVIRRTGHRKLLQQIEQVLEVVFLVEVTRAICQHAGRLEPPELRTLGAIHVATALSLATPDLAFITYDDRQAAAARTCGLEVLQPGRFVRHLARGS